MSSMNMVILIGNVGQDPEVRHFASGTPVCNLSLATSETWKDKTSGEKKEKTEWHRLVFIDRLAEVVGEYVRKGSKISVVGKIETRKWTDKEGVERETKEIKCHEMKMLGGTGQRDDAPAHGDRAPAPRPTAAPRPAAAAKEPFDDMDSDIPF